MGLQIDYDSNSFGQTYFDFKGSEKYVSRGKGFDIIGISEDTDTGEAYYKVRCQKFGADSEFDIPISDAMDANALADYRKYGLTVNDSNKRLIPEVFQQKEDEYIENGGIVGKLHSIAGIKECIDENGEPILVYAGAENPVNNSKYCGKFDIEPEGDPDKWFGFVKSLVRHSSGIAFILAFAFAAVLHGVLKGKKDIDNLILHLRSESSVGKSTMLELAVSVFGNPDTKCADGLARPWNSTHNAILRRMMGEGSQRGGILYALDEIDLADKKNIDRLLYALASGVERDRLTARGKRQKSMTGHFFVISTGEDSLLEMTKENPGLTVRVIEMDDHMWTDSAKQSEDIKEFIHKNYGHGATEFGLHLGRWIQQNGMDALCEKLENCRKAYQDKCTITERKERKSGRYGLILLSAEFLNLFFDFAIDIEELRNFMIENETNNSEDLEGYADFYNKLVGQIVKEDAHFIHLDNSKKKLSDKAKQAQYLPSIKEQWGLIEPIFDTIELPEGRFAQSIAYIERTEFDNIVRKRLNYEDSKSLRKWLKKNGLSRCEDDRGYCRMTINHVELNYVAVYLPGEEDRGKICREELVKELLCSGNTFRKKNDMEKLGECIIKLKEYRDMLDESQIDSLNRMIRKYNYLEEKKKNGKDINSSLFDDIED